MSRENVKVVRALYDTLSAGDVAAAVRHVHPDVRVRPGIAPVEQGERIDGRHGVKQFFETLLVWESRRVDFEEVLAAGDRLVIVESWQFRGSQDIELNVAVTDVYTFRDGLIVDVEGFVDRADALASVGLAD